MPKLRHSELPFTALATGVKRLHALPFFTRSNLAVIIFSHHFCLLFFFFFLSRPLKTRLWVCSRFISTRYPWPLVTYSPDRQGKKKET